MSEKIVPMMSQWCHGGYVGLSWRQIYNREPLLRTWDVQVWMWVHFPCRELSSHRRWWVALWEYWDQVFQVEVRTSLLGWMDFVLPVSCIPQNIMKVSSITLRTFRFVLWSQIHTYRLGTVRLKHILNTLKEKLLKWFDQFLVQRFYWL